MYLKREEGFTCPKCGKGPLCRNHRFPGNRVCTSCAFDAKARTLTDLKSQEQSIRSFLRLAQFVFILFAIFFVSLKLGMLDEVEFLQLAPLTDYVIYAMGGASVLSYILFYIILLGQRNKTREIESELSKLKFRRLAK